MAAKIPNPRKRFMFSITFVKHPINSYLFQTVTIPEKSIEEARHGDVNRDVKTAGRVMFGSLMCTKLLTTSGSDTWLWDWMQSCQDTLLGGGLTPNEYWEDLKIDELAEDGTSVVNTWIIKEAWPMRLNGQELSRMSSENSIESIELSVGDVEKL